MTIEDLFESLTLRYDQTQSGGEPMHWTIKTPIPGDPDGWYIELVWMHHDGDISCGTARGATFSEAAEKAMGFLR